MISGEIHTTHVGLNDCVEDKLLKNFPFCETFLPRFPYKAVKESGGASESYPEALIEVLRKPIRDRLLRRIAQDKGFSVESVRQELATRIRDIYVAYEMHYMPHIDPSEITPLAGDCYLLAYELGDFQFGNVLENIIDSEVAVLIERTFRDEAGDSLNEIEAMVNLCITCALMGIEESGA